MRHQIKYMDWKMHNTKNMVDVKVFSDPVTGTNVLMEVWGAACPIVVMDESKDT